MKGIILIVDETPIEKQKPKQPTPDAISTSNVLTNMMEQQHEAKTKAEAMAQTTNRGIQ